MAQLCDALETRPPRSFAECEELKASVGAEDHQAAARAAAAGLQARGGKALRELQELDPARQMRLRALFLTSREPSSHLTLFEKSGGKLLGDLTGQRRLELCRRLLATWEAVLGDGWRIEDLLGVLESSQDERETKLK